jgi:signal transduction histidine kinase
MEPSSEVIGSVHAESLLLDHLVADLQELALAEAGQLPLNRRPVSLPAMIEQAVAAVRPEANDKGLQVSVNLTAALPEVDADPQRIGQVLRNLLRNAIQHTPTGGEIEVTAVRQDNKVQVSVRDNGEGIASEHLPHLFDRFYRADPSRARATGGTGLGLAIVKGVVEAHGGCVWAESTPGENTIFHFTLPACETPIEIGVWHSKPVQTG